MKGQLVMGTRDYPITHDERRWIALWKAHGGTQHGPRVEHVSMEYDKFFDFCASLEAKSLDSIREKFEKAGADERKGWAALNQRRAYEDRTS